MYKSWTKSLEASVLKIKSWKNDLKAPDKRPPEEREYFLRHC